MNLIDQACRAAVRREFNLPSVAGGCLAMNRVATEYGLKWLDRELYVRVPPVRGTWNTAEPRQGPFASEMLEGFRQKGWVIAEAPQPGCWVFGDIPKLQGHTGLVFRGEDGRLYVLENTGFERGTVLYGAVRFVRLEEWDPITAVVRFPAELVERPDPAPPVVAPSAPAPGTIRVLNAANNRLVTTTTLTGANKDKVYIRPEFLDPRFR